MNKNLFLYLVFSAFSVVCFAQISQSEVSAQLANRNIPEDSLRVRLLAKGIDANNIDPSNFQQFQEVVEETILEFEVAKNQRIQKDETIADVAKVIAEHPEVNEELSINNLPKSNSGPIKYDENEIYGHRLFFENGLVAKQSSTNIKPPNSYILGSGDKVLINIFGPSAFSGGFEINADGYISEGANNSNKTGILFRRLYLKGLTFEQGKDAAFRHFSDYFNFARSQFEMSLAESRNVTVHLYGEVKEKGSISIPATNSLINALSFSGGINKIGSVRLIKFISGSKTQFIDIYKLLDDPSLMNRLYMSENDVIHIPIAEKVVQITGSVGRPMKYELLPNEQLSDLIKFAGGVNSDAYLSDIEITRFDGVQKVVVNANLKDIINGSFDYDLRNGDEIFVKKIEGAIQNVVYINGAVKKPGKYEKKANSKISDLLNLGALNETARRDFAYLLRFRPDSSYSYQQINLNEILNNPRSNIDLDLNNMDRLVILEQAKFANSYSFGIVGAVRQPDQFNFDPSGVLKISDAILLSGGLLQSASDIGFVIRKDPSEPKTTEYIPFNPILISNNPSSPNNIVVEPNDLIRVINKENYRDEFFVTVSGAVRSPGVFAYDPDMDLKELLQMANGLKFSAAKNKIDITRIIIEENKAPKTVSYTAEVDRDLTTIGGSESYSKIMPLDHIIVREIPGFELERIVYLKGEIDYPGPYSILDDNERLSSIVRRAGGITKEAYPDGAGLFREQNNTGFIVTQLNKALDNPDSIWDLILQDGDTLYIPKRENIVHIEGAINAKSIYRDEFLDENLSVSVGHEGNKNALYYVNEYGGGVSKNGSRSRISVRQLNGKIEKTKTFLFIRSYPKVREGGTIVVGRKPDKKGTGPNEEKEPVEWNNILRDTIAQVTAVLTLILLLNRASN